MEVDSQKLLSCTRCSLSSQKTQSFEDSKSGVDSKDKHHRLCKMQIRTKKAKSKSQSLVAISSKVETRDSS